MDEALLSLLLEKDFEYITVKDVCDRAGVNRSTFYLHYENTVDLLSETVTALQRRFHITPPTFPSTVSDIPRKELFFITDQYLLPWLDTVKENKHIYKALHQQIDAFGVERSYDQFFQNIFSPILSRYGVDRKKHSYIMEFYRHGLVAILMKWVDSGCKESTTEIADIIKLCVGYAADEKTE